MDQTMLLNRERFLKTEFGAALEELIREWDSALETREDENGVRHILLDGSRRNIRERCLAQWEVYQLAMKQFYGIEFHFTRTDEYFGVCTEDGQDWLLKVDRNLALQRMPAMECGTDISDIVEYCCRRYSI